MMAMQHRSCTTRCQSCAVQARNLRSTVKLSHVLALRHQRRCNVAVIPDYIDFILWPECNLQNMQL